MTTALRPMSLGELLDRAFFLYRKNFVLFVGIVALPLLLVLAIGIATIASRVVMRPDSMMWGWLLAYPVMLFVTAAWWSATVAAVSQVYLDQPTGVMAAYAAVKNRILRVGLIILGLGIAVGILFAAVIALGAVAGTASGNIGIGVLAGLVLCVPAIILALRWSLTVPVAVLEGTGLSKSAARSSALAKGNVLRLFVIVVMFLVLTYIVYLVWEIPLLAAAGIFSRDVRQVPAGTAVMPIWTLVVMSVGSFLTQTLLGPLLTITLSLVYYDARVRKEAFDLQVMMSSLDSMQAVQSAATGV